MVINLGKGGLFGPQGLEQETGSISERWGQDGSSIVNISGGTSSSSTLRTNTAGKRLLVSSVTVFDYSTTGAGQLKDGGSGGTTKFDYFIPVAGTYTFSFPTPLYFDTDVYFSETSPSSGTISISGWEEREP